MSANKNKEIKNRENFMLSGKLSELAWEPKSEEQITKDLFKGSDPDKMIDAFEKQQGISVKDTEVRNTVYKCIDLSPCTNEDDKALLEKFYNNPAQYQIAHRSDNWTQRGELKIFLEYYEDVDIRIAKEEESAT